MKKLSVPAKVFRAASLFKAKNDFRYYLCGVYIGRNEIVATDGHTMFIHERETGVDESRIIDVVGMIPAKTETIEFEMVDDRLVAWMLDIDGRVISANKATLIEGKYPDYKRVVKSHSVPTSEVGVNAAYLGRLEKAAKIVGNSKYMGVTLTLNGSSDAMTFEIKGNEYTSKVIIMPMRL